MKGLNLYYIFNNRRFFLILPLSASPPTSGAVPALLLPDSPYPHTIWILITPNCPPIIQETMNPGMKVDHIKYTNISLNFGYAYNWVFARNCLACLSLNPAVAYKTSRINKAEGEKDDWYKNFNIDFILRAGVVYNNSKYFVGTSFVGRTYDYYRNNFLIEQRLRDTASVCRL